MNDTKWNPTAHLQGIAARLIPLNLTGPELGSLLTAVELVKVDPVVRRQAVDALRAKLSEEMQASITFEDITGLAESLWRALDAEKTVAEFQGCDAEGLYPIRYIDSAGPDILVLLGVVTKIMRKRHPHQTHVLSSVMQKVEESLAIFIAMKNSPPSSERVLN